MSSWAHPTHQKMLDSLKRELRFLEGFRRTAYCWPDARWADERRRRVSAIIEQVQRARTRRRQSNAGDGQS